MPVSCGGPKGILARLRGLPGRFAYLDFVTCKNSQLYRTDTDKSARHPRTLETESRQLHFSLSFTKLASQLSHARAFAFSCGRHVRKANTAEKASLGISSTENSMIKVLIADDHPIVREGLKLIIRATRDITVAGEASNAEEVLNQIMQQDFQVALLDISMPGRNGLDILKQLKSIRPGLHSLILSTHPEEQYAVRALKSGAAGYLTKDSVPEELITAIRKAAQGGKYISAGLAERLAFDAAGNTVEFAHEMLSDREYQVMRMIASGKTVKQIGEELALSIKTISTYRRRILEKMHMRSNAEIIYYAIHGGLVN
jgi:DNA-binding NarL/FixJ family response regulator